jgi:hypothetical protein
VSVGAIAVEGYVRLRLPRGVRLRRHETRREWTSQASERVFKADHIAIAVLKR